MSSAGHRVSPPRGSPPDAGGAGGTRSTGGIGRPRRRPRRRRSWDTARPPRLEMLPLLDVVFLLLVVFLYAMVTMVRSHVIPVDLPALATGESKDPSSVLVVSVGAEGSIAAGGEVIPLEDLAPRVRALREKDPDLEVLLNADAAARHGDVARVLDSVRAAGQRRILMLGKPPDAKPPR